MCITRLSSKHSHLLELKDTNKKLNFKTYFGLHSDHDSFEVERSAQYKIEFKITKTKLRFYVYFYLIKYFVSSLYPTNITE